MNLKTVHRKILTYLQRHSPVNTFRLSSITIPCIFLENNLIDKSFIMQPYETSLERGVLGYND